MEISQALRDARARYRGFLVADDLQREALIQHADSQALTDFGDAVEPLFGEINATLDRPTAIGTSIIRRR